MGHAGTLDPMATGVLLIGAGRATRLLGHLALTDKSYRATIRLGQATVTDDAEGDVVSAAGAAGITLDAVVAALPAFTGLISQVPSAVSAIKVDGKRAYARVRAGEEGRRAQGHAKVTVSRFDLLASREEQVDGLPVLDLDVVIDCTSGTYIRALARDLGPALGTGGPPDRPAPHPRRRVHLRPGLALDAEGLAGEAAPPLLGLAEVARRAFAVVEVDAGRGRRHRVRAGPRTAGRARRSHRAGAGDELLALYRPRRCATALRSGGRVRLSGLAS